MGKLKVLLVCEQPLPSRKRAGRPNYTLKYLSQWGHELTVVCPRPREISMEEYSNVNFEYINHDFDQFSIYKRIKIYLEFKKKLKELLSKEKFDIIRSINIMPTYASLSSDNRPIVYAELTDFISDLYYQFGLPLRRIVKIYLSKIEKKIAKKIDFANVETPVGRRFWKKLGANEKRIAVIPNGVDSEHFMKAKLNNNLREKLNIGKNDKVVAYHGDFGKLDGLDFLIRSMKCLGDEVKLLIIGSGEKRYENHLKTLVNSLSLNERVNFTGWIDYEYLPDYLNIANCFTVPIIAETRVNISIFHTKIREYLCLGKPFVVTETEGLRWALEEIPYYVKDPMNPKELATKIILALNNGLEEYKIKKMREIALQIDWKNIIKMDEIFMQNIVNNSIEEASQFDIKLKL